MKKIKLLFTPIIILGTVLQIAAFGQHNLSGENKGETEKNIQLPPPRFDSETSVEEALKLRRSTREYTDEPLSISDISQILWAAQGITKKKDEPSKYWLEKYEYQGGYRTAPSAGALFPMELYLVVGNVEGLSEGVYKYIPKNHSIKKVLEGNKIMAVHDVALKQKAISDAQVLLIMAGVYERTEAKYGERAQRYVHIEVGAICQNVYLQGISLGIGTVMIGAFKDEPLKEVLQLPEEEHPLGIMPLGRMPEEGEK